MKGNKITKAEILAIAVIFAVSLFLRLYPAATNEFPKGSDSYFHIRVAEEVVENGSPITYDSLTGSVNSYPPLFHVLLSALFRLYDPFAVARLIGPVLGFASLLVFFLFVSSVFGRRVAICSAFAYGVAAEAISKSVFAAPEGLGVLLIFIALYEFNRYDEKRGKAHLYASAAATMAALTHPLSFLMLFVFLFAFFRDARKIAAVMAVPTAALAGWVLYMNSLGASSVLIPTVMTPDYFFFGFSPALLALAIVGMRRAGEMRMVVPAYLLLLAAMFLPFYPERVFAFSIIPGSVIAGFGLSDIMGKKGWMKYVAVLFIAAVAVSQAVEINNPFGYAKTELRWEDYEALTWARDNLPDTAVAGTWQVSGAWIPEIAERRTILGAFQESVWDYEQRRRDIYGIFTSTDKAYIEETMKKYGAGYVFVNSYEERSLYNGAAERLASMFPAAFDNGYARIFRVG